MRFAVGADEVYPVQDAVVAALRERGHEVVRFGAVETRQDAPWAEVGERVGRAVASGDCDQGVLFCWTGTGISMAANKVPGVRAALVTDAQTAAGARIWNHANVLCLSNRLLAPDVAKEIVAAWLDTDPGTRGEDGVRLLGEVDARNRR